MYPREFACPGCVGKSWHDKTGQVVTCTLCHGAGKFQITHVEWSQPGWDSRRTVELRATAMSPVSPLPLFPDTEVVREGQGSFHKLEARIQEMKGESKKPEKKESFKRDNADWDF